MTSFLNLHYLRFMEAYHAGELKKITVEDIAFTLPPSDNAGATAVYCIANDLDTEEWVPKLLATLK